VSSPDPLARPLRVGAFRCPTFQCGGSGRRFFYTIEIRIRDFHGGEGLPYSAYLFKRQQVGECHDASPIGPNALVALFQNSESVVRAPLFSEENPTKKLASRYRRMS
jgi:hypothetical protein